MRIPVISFDGNFWIVMLCDVCVILASIILAFLLRFDTGMNYENWVMFGNLALPLLVIKLAVFRYMGLRRGWWRYVSLPDVIDIFKANVAASLLFLGYLAITYGMRGVSRSIIIMDFILCFLLSCAVRFVTRAYKEDYLGIRTGRSASLNRTLIVGAGSAGQMIVREVRQNPSLEKSIVGFIDDDSSKLGKRFQGIDVLGTREEMAKICCRERINEIIIAIPSASGTELRPIVEKCRKTGVPFKTLPGVGDLIDGKASLKQARDVDLNDLLGRKPVRLEVDKIQAFIQGKIVLVTGAAGSIGSEICRQVARFSPQTMILFENAETPLFHLERELAEKYPELRQIPLIGDVRNKTEVETVFRCYRPEVVFHAAAYKHVPMMELNPAAAACNNVHGTRVVADASHSFGVRSFVMISTDKAVNPTSVMGASKRTAELYVQNIARYSRTRFVTVRFGNVLGSNGSVVPIFREQIEKGGPVTVTHPEIIRYFMTIPEASQLVLQAGSMGDGGEIFILDMGEPVKIVHLAEELIRLCGFRPYEDIDIVFTGMRPGEKLYEELLLDGEGIRPTRHEKIKVAKASYCDWNELRQRLDKLRSRVESLDVEGTKDLLEDIVPEYGPVDQTRRQPEGDYGLGEKLVFGIRELPNPKKMGVFYCRTRNAGEEIFLTSLDLHNTDTQYLARRFREALQELLRKKGSSFGATALVGHYETENIQPWAEVVLKNAALDLKGKPA